MLTCSVIETDAVTVVPSQAELEPSAMQLPPFEVIGGSHGADLQTADRRFFQYEYRCVSSAKRLFGKDVKLPELKITYKVRTRTNGEALEGRDQAYVLPPISVRVLSLVPADATDIRDASLETFADIDRRLSRANAAARRRRRAHRLRGAGCAGGGRSLRPVPGAACAAGSPDRWCRMPRSFARVGRELADIATHAPRRRMDAGPARRAC